MVVGLGFFAVELANLLVGISLGAAFLAHAPVSERSGWTCTRFPCPSRSSRRQRPRPVTELLRMQDFSSSAYWNRVYASGKDGGGQEAVREWHVDGEVVVQTVERLVGSPSSTSEERAVLNVGCGQSTLSERQVLRFFYAMVCLCKFMDRGPRLFSTRPASFLTEREAANHFSAT